MSYAAFEAKVKNIKLGKDGKKEVVLDIEAIGKNDLYELVNLQDKSVTVTLDDKQLALDLNFEPPKNTMTVNISPSADIDDQAGESQSDGADQASDNKEEKVPKEIIEAFILSGLAPSYDDLPYDFPALLARKKDGETWLSISSSLGLSSGKWGDIWREYKKRVEPLAKKWHEWQQQQSKAAEQQAEAAEEPEKEDGAA